LLRAIAEAMAPFIPPGTQVLEGLEMGGIPIVTIVTMLSQVTNIPAAFIRKEPKAYGTCRYAEGASLQGKRFILVEDVVSSGGAIIDALAKLKADGIGSRIGAVRDRPPDRGHRSPSSGGPDTQGLVYFEAIERS
jgi:orotate phosphoribosyltransferase